MDLVSSLKLGDGTLSLGVRNLLNNQYFNINNQLNFGFDPAFAIDALVRVGEITGKSKQVQQLLDKYQQRVQALRRKLKDKDNLQEYLGWLQTTD